MVRHAARMVRNGELGEIKVVQAEHASGWAAKLLEKQGHTQAAWRMDPGLLGDASVLYDLGTHAHQLTRFITDLEVTEVAAELSQIVAGRAIKDNANLLLRFSNGAVGTLWASMAAVGNEHGLRIRIYGDRGSLAWHHEDPQHLRDFPIDGPPQILAQGADWLSPDAAKWTRAGLGIPKAFLRRLRISTLRLRMRSSPKRRERHTRNRSWGFRMRQTGSKAWPLWRARCALTQPGAHGLR